MKTTDTRSLALQESLFLRKFLAVAAIAGAMMLTAPLFADQDGKKTFTILHTNDMHASFIGMGPASDYTPFSLNDDSTRGGYARLAAMIAKRAAAHKDQGRSNYTACDPSPKFRGALWCVT